MFLSNFLDAVLVLIFFIRTMHKASAACMVHPARDVQLELTRYRQLQVSDCQWIICILIAVFNLPSLYAHPFSIVTIVPHSRLLYRGWQMALKFRTARFYRFAYFGLIKLCILSQVVEYAPMLSLITVALVALYLPHYCSRGRRRKNAKTGLSIYTIFVLHPSWRWR